MSAAWPIWNNDNPLPGRPPRAWVPVVIQNPGHPVPTVAAPGVSLLDLPAPRKSARWACGPLASLLFHATALAAGIFMFLPADDGLDIEGSAVEVEIIAMQTVATNEVSEVQSDATQSMVSAGGEVIEATEPETLDPVEPEQATQPETAEPVETEAVETVEPTPLEEVKVAEVTEPAPPVQQDEPVKPVEMAPVETAPLLASTAITPEPLEAAQPETAEAIETPDTPQITSPENEVVEAVDPDAPPVPKTRTVAQRQEPTYPKEPAKPKAETPKKQEPQKPKPNQGGNGGNSNADAQARASVASQQGTGPQGNGAALTKYQGQVLSKIRRALRNYRGPRGNGELVVQFVASANGTASGISVISSSGNAGFDAAAVDIIRRAAPFPPIPADAGTNSWTFKMPFGSGR